jgi:hypothetical protein
MRQQLRWPALVLISSIATAALAVADVHGPVRVVATFWFLLACPGLAVAPLLPTRSAGAGALTTIALSLVLDTLVATALLAAGDFSPGAGLAALAAVCALGCGAQLAQWVRQARVTEIYLHA